MARPSRSAAASRAPTACRGTAPAVNPLRPHRSQAQHRRSPFRLVLILKFLGPALKAGNTRRLTTGECLSSPSWTRKACLRRAMVVVVGSLRRAEQDPPVPPSDCHLSLISLIDEADLPATRRAVREKADLAGMLVYGFRFSSQKAH